MTTATRALIALALLILVAAGSVALVQRGTYGWTVFIAIPVCAGGILCWASRARTAGKAATAGVLTGVAGSCFFLVTGIEGIICVVMALLPAVVLSVLGSLIVYCCLGFEENRTATMLLLLPVTFWFDTHAKPRVYAARTSLVVHGSPSIGGGGQTRSSITFTCEYSSISASYRSGEVDFFAET